MVVLIVLSLLPGVPTATSEDDHRSPPSEPISTNGTAGIFSDEFDDDVNLTLDGQMIVRDGMLTLDPVRLMEDGFNRSDVAPWTVTGGSPTLVDGRLHLNSSTGVNDTVTRAIDHDDIKLSVWMNFTTYGTGGPFITFKFEDKSLRYLYDYGAEEMILQVIEPGGNVIVIDDGGSAIREDLEFSFRACVEDDEPLFHIQQQWSPSYAPNWRFWPYEFNRTGNVTEIELGCWGGADGYLEDLEVVDLGSEGTALSPIIDLPPGCIWDEGYASGYWDFHDDAGVVSFVDADTGDDIPGYRMNSYFASDLQGIDIFKHPSIRIKVWFWLVGSTVPYLHHWSISWRPGAPCGWIPSTT